MTCVAPTVGSRVSCDCLQAAITLQDSCRQVQKLFLQEGEVPALRLTLVTVTSHAEQNIRNEQLHRLFTHLLDVPSTHSGAGEAEGGRQEEGGSGKEEPGEEEGGGGRGAEAPRQAEAGAAALGQRVRGPREAAGETGAGGGCLAEDGGREEAAASE